MDLSTLALLLGILCLKTELVFSEEDDKMYDFDDMANMTSISEKCQEFLKTLKFQFSSDKQVWDSSRYFCQKKGMELMMFDNEEKYECLQQYIDNEDMANERFFTGLQVNSNNVGVWPGGVPATFNDWVDDKPLKFQCMVLWQGAWYNSDCNVINYYICEPNPNAPKIVEQELCKKDVVYEISPFNANWNSARLICNSKNMDLVSLETPEENICVLDKLIKAEMSLKYVFTSLTMDGQTNYTSWKSEEALSYSGWGSGQPAQFGKEKCMILHKNAWHDLPCDAEASFICESASHKIPTVCKDGESSKYFVSNVPAPRDLAIKKCLMMDMELASFDSMDENNCAKSLIIKANLTTKTVLMTLNKIGTDNFVWGTGKKMEFTDWAKGQPNNPTKEKCVAIHKNGWHDVSCDQHLHYICKKPDTPAVSCASANLKISTDKAVWRQARNNCRKQGMQLASLETYEENICALKEIEKKSLSDASVYFGLDMLNEKNYTKWGSGTPLSYNDWAKGQPNNVHFDEKCVGFSKNYWHDFNCFTPNYYICETSSVATTSEADEVPCQTGSKYFVSPTKANIRKAQKICKEKGMDLVSLETPDENNCIKNLIEKADLTMSHVFTSLSWFGKNNFSTWYNGKDLAYSDWAKGEPNRPADEKCVSLLRDKWHDVGCNIELNFICESNPVFSKDGCAPILAGSQYTISTVKKNWNNARAICKNKGMDLASFDTAEENFCVKNLIADSDMSNKFVFTSLTMLKQTNFTKWMSGSSLSYLNWAKGQPANFPSKKCMGVLNEGWHATDCNQLNHFICEGPATAAGAGASAPAPSVVFNKSSVFL